MRALEQRLADLERTDPITAAQLRACMGNGLGDDIGGLIAPSIAAWVSEERSASPEILIVMGTPNTAELNALLSNLPSGGHILIAEKDSARAMELFRREPIEEHVAANRLSLALGDNPERIEERFFRVLKVEQAPSFRILETSRVQSEDLQFYAAALERTRNQVRLNLFNAGTMLCKGPMWQYNTINNLPLLLRNPGIRSLVDIFQGKPAVVVGAGPSLDESLHSLRQIADGFVIVSTGTALKPLLRAGIRPDLVVSVDGSHLTAPQFDVDRSELFLACSSLAFPPILNGFRGIFSGSLDASPLDSWIDSIGGRRGNMFAGGTVTATALDLAAIMGCNPVISIGLDLCFADDGTTHGSHTMYHGRRVDTERLVKVPGNFRNDVLTTNQFRCYIDLIAEYVEKRTGVTFINATHGGARIGSMKVISPSGMGCLAAKPFSAYDAIAAVHAAHVPLASSAAKISEVIAQLEKSMLHAREGAMICNQALLALRPGGAGPAAVREYYGRLDQLDRELAEAGACNAFIGMSLWPASYRSNALRLEHEKTYTDSMLAARRTRELYEQVAGAARWTRDLLAQILPQLESTGEPRKETEEPVEMQSVCL